jgi:hypothetical protein
MDINFFRYKSEYGSNIERILAEVWLDANYGEWPKMNQGQRKALVERAFKDLEQMGVTQCYQKENTERLVARR